MLRLLIPDLYVESLFDIQPELLRKRGIRALILDLDNTLIVHGEEKVEPRVHEWVGCLQQNGFKLCIASNNYPDRGERLAQTLGLPGVFRAVKPRGKAFRKALALLGTRPEETAMVGDQLFTDVLGGNRMGLYTILVSSLGGRDFFMTRLIIRRVERLLLPWIKGRSGAV
ncbi:MAG TPA: YqeG family HAD IIIA-type phosphatase [Desulfotomaculum sp.]|nr:YqeG family HAD IIIA-type phosphatase [Desulfotomaculum sp.]